MWFVLIAVTLFFIYWFGTRNYNYWSERQVKHDPPIPFFGTNAKQYLQKASYATIATECYKKFPNEKIVGFYRGGTPELVIRDPEIIKRILVTDFNHFYSRGFNKHQNAIEPLLKNLFFADGDLWKLLRQRFSPTFSTSKLRSMFHIISERAEKLQVTAGKLAEEFHEIDAKELIARYTTDFIGAYGFGIDMDTLNNNNITFRKLGERIFKRTVADATRAVLKEILPTFFKHLNYLDKKIESHMVKLVSGVFSARNYQPSGYNDFIDLMLNLRKQGVVIGDSIEKVKNDGTPEKAELVLDDLLITAQIFVFFGAGFETSSSTSSFALHLLAFNPIWQEKVQKEIDEVLERYDSKITYDAINEMSLLEMVFKEGMRMFPSVAYLRRQCASPTYTIPEVGVTITEGVVIMIPIQALHNDEQYFEDPETFNPLRFSPEAKKGIPKYVYMPFGEGPRACVGARLGLMQAMAGIAAILQKFTVEPAPNSKYVPTPDPTAIVAENILGGLPLLLKKR